MPFLPVRERLPSQLGQRWTLASRYLLFWRRITEFAGEAVGGGSGTNGITGKLLDDEPAMPNAPRSGEEPRTEMAARPRPWRLTWGPLAVRK